MCQTREGLARAAEEIYDHMSLCWDPKLAVAAQGEEEGGERTIVPSRRVPRSGSEHNHNHIQGAEKRLLSVFLFHLSVWVECDVIDFQFLVSLSVRRVNFVCVYD